MGTIIPLVTQIAKSAGASWNFSTTTFMMLLDLAAQDKSCSTFLQIYSVENLEEIG